MGAWNYTYDGLGQLKTQTDARSQVTTLTYDLLGRVTQRAETGLTSTWTFGTTAPSIGRLVTATTSAGYTRALTYDSLSRPSTTTLTIGGTNYLTTTTYDTTNGQIATVARPSGFTETRVYTSLGYLSQLKDGSTSLFTVTTRDAELHLTQSTAGNSVVTTAAFDLDTGLPQTLRAGTGGGVASFDYAYDTVGNLVGRTDNDMIYTERFCYDALNRLTSYQLTTSTSCPLSGGTTKTVTYDSLGNITAKSDVGSYTYPASGGSSVRPHAVSSITGTVNAVVNPNYHYDANGNLDCVHTGSYPAGCTGGGAVRKIVSTSFNMADTITDGTTTVAFTYDSEHSRIVQASTVGGVTTTTNYLNDPASGAMSEKAVTGLAAIWTDYLTAHGQIVAQRTAGLPPSVWNSFTWGAAPWTAPAAWSYFSLDPLSSIAVIADANGNIAQRLSYDAWGKPRNSDGTDAACGTIKSPSTRGFTNQEQIAALCQVNLNARIYDPTIARFLTPDDMVSDPYDPQGLNRYTYVDNRPLTLTDPTGHDPDDRQAQSKSPGQGATGSFASNGDFHSAEMHDGSLTTLSGTGYSNISFPSDSGENSSPNPRNGSSTSPNGDGDTRVAANTVGGRRPNEIGAVGEANSIDALKKAGFKIIGTQVPVSTGFGTRVYDVLVRAPDGRVEGVDSQGDIYGVESKATTVGKIVLKLSQVKMDESVVQHGGFTDSGLKVTGVIYHVSSDDPKTAVRPFLLMEALRVNHVKFISSPYTSDRK